MKLAPMFFLTFLVVMKLVLESISRWPFANLTSNSSQVDKVTDEALSFMVNGDWGGSRMWPYTTPAQTSVATALGQQAGEIGASFTLLLGDNFYSRGVKSVDDHRWINTFENVFTSLNLQSERHFRVVAGNHDYKGNVSAQIAYSSKSPRWFFPSEYYEFVEGISGVDGNLAVHFVMIDTNILIEETPESQRHWTWLRKVLAGSSADFLVVAGHHPVWSSCKHGPSQKLVRELKPLLDAARASIYLSGHDHCAEHIGENVGVQYHVIGAGAGFSGLWPWSKRSTIPEGLSKWLHAPVAPWKGAFAKVVVDRGGLVLTHLDSEGQVLYVAPAITWRQQSVIIS